MAGTIVPSGSALLSLRETWNNEWGLAPTEESVIAGIVAEPGVDRIGNGMFLRKIDVFSASTLAAGDSGAGLTGQNPTDDRVQVVPTYKFVYWEIAPHVLTRVLQDSAYRAAMKKQAMAAITEAREADIFALASGLSVTTAGVDLDDTLFRDAFGLLAQNAKGKVDIFNGGGGGKGVYLVIHASEITNALKIDAVREYRIRGSAGATTTGQAVTTYGVEIRESGLVLNSGGSLYNVLMLNDAFAIGYNIKPMLVPDQKYQLQERFAAVAEYGVNEWFDSSGVSIVTSV